MKNLRDHIRTLYRRYLHYKVARRLLSHIISTSNRLNKLYGTLNKCLILVPSDPETIIGSRGDEAMIVASLQYYRRKYAGAPIYIIHTSDSGKQKFLSSGIDQNISFLKTKEGKKWSDSVLEMLKEIKPSDMIILGADCMDGKYSSILSLGLLGIYAYGKGLGIETKLLGFSLNKAVPKILRKAFNEVGINLDFSLRDAQSLTRFQKITNCQGRLVADVAFLLRPDFNCDSYIKFSNWVSSQRSNERDLIVGLNFHPMLKKYSSHCEQLGDAKTVANNIDSLLCQDCRLSIALIPHDDREAIGDNEMLQPIYDILVANGHKERIYFDSTVYRSNQIKAIVSLCDILISSRMHLAIAALGMGVPVMGASYQDKFEGLLQHFKLPVKMILTADEFTSDTFLSRYNDFCSNLSEYRATIVDSLPGVMEKSELNLI